MLTISLEWPYTVTSTMIRVHDQIESRGFLLAGWLCLTKIVAEDNQLTKQFPFKSIHYCCFWFSCAVSLSSLVLFLLYRDVSRYLLLYDFKMSFLNILLSWALRSAQYAGTVWRQFVDTYSFATWRWFDLTDKDRWWVSVSVQCARRNIQSHS